MDPSSSPVGASFGKKTVQGMVTAAMPTKMIKAGAGGLPQYQIMIRTELNNHVRFFLPSSFNGVHADSRGNAVRIAAPSPDTRSWEACEVDDMRLLVGMTVKVTGFLRKTGDTSYSIHPLTVKILQI